jgi:FkbM family methyltransferase
MNDAVANALWKLDVIAGLLKLPFPRSPSLHREVASALHWCPSPSFVVDGGANRGEWSATVQAHCKPERLVLVEPSPVLANALKMRFADDPRIGVVPAALSNRVGFAPLFAPESGSAFASLVPRESVHADFDFQRTCEQVELLDAPELLRRTGLPRIDLLKLDVEGHEYGILEAMSAEFRSSIRCIQFEFGGACIDARVFFRDFWKLLAPDLDILRIARTGVIPIRRYREREERFEQANFLCVNRRIGRIAS